MKRKVSSRAKAVSSPAQESQLAAGAAAPSAKASPRVEVTLSLCPAAYGLLVAMAAYDEIVSVEACILTQLSENIEAWCKAISRAENVQELFLSGEVLVKKEEA
jgi:hypothetical protein